jgi:hypothetical protein
MREKYFPPKYNEQQFHCIHCGVFARQEWFDTAYLDGHWLYTDVRVAVCQHCNRLSFWYEEKLAIPVEAPVEPPHPDLPKSCEQDYIEARNVFVNSPRSAAALLRLCIQKLMPVLGEKGENINDDIKSLVSKGLPVLIQKALDICRVVGNNAVHPGEIDINDTPEIAQKLFSMINFIIENQITLPREIEKLYGQLPENSLKAIDKRDAKKD